MPVREHIEIARAGSARIGQYRAAQPNIRFDVSGADLSGIDLSAADLVELTSRVPNLRGHSLQM
jgi:uncharacterized protein YjbI with pentapeptide repeats